jgi:hypothetical protein
MRINSLEELNDLELACQCGGETKTLLKAMTIEGGDEDPTVLTVSYYIPDTDEDDEAHRPGCPGNAPADGGE